MAIAHSRTGRVGLAAVAALVAAPVLASDYPTAARVDYVLACMASNGQNYIMMERCSCSIDAIAETIPFESYERIETILRMREGQGELALLFRSSPVLEEQVQAFKEAQVEADLRCF
jgi:hypothetical protein